MMRYFTIVLRILFIVALASSAIAQTDGFGDIDRIYLDSVAVVAGQDVNIRCNLTNDEPISIISIPLVYDPALLTLKSIHFTGSRAGYIQSKVINPGEISQIHGHFVVALIKTNEVAVPAGDGLLFTATFSLAASAPTGTTLIIDSLFYPPGGELMLTENSTTQAIRPAFTAGKVVVRGENHAPKLIVANSIAVLEGDTLVVGVGASDPDSDPLELQCTAKPTGATFATDGDSCALRWVPAFIGPYSAVASPLTLTFWVSDGQTSVEQEVSVHIINSNRPPVIEAPATVAVMAGNSLEFPVSATDPDFETVSWEVRNQPQGASFGGSASSTGLTMFSWTPPVASPDDTTVVQFIGSDPEGFADTANVTVVVQAATLYTLSVDTTSGYPGDVVTVDVLLENEFPVAGFNVLVQYDVSVLTPTEITKVGTRASAFESFIVTQEVNGLPGTVRIVGVSSNAGPGVSPLPSGSGAIAKLTFQTSNELAYQGLSVPVRFLFNDPLTKNDNTLVGTTGTKIEQADISYFDGYVTINSFGEIRLGDINLNGLAYDIGDAIYFTNHFVYPSEYPFSVLQFANSDVNQDGYVATIADLVRLIKIITEGGLSKAVATGDLMAELAYESSAGGMSIDYSADFAVGGVLLQVVTSQALGIDGVSCAHPTMTHDVSQRGDTVTILVYSLTGESMPAGTHSLVTITGLTDARLQAVDMASDDGRRVSVETAAKTLAIPGEYQLAQNYPNPFNPDTRIEFSLPTASTVTVSVFDVLGRTVCTLAEGMYPAGHHSVTWSGHDERGQAVASGVYFYRLESGGTALTRKMMLVK